jgi:cytochrome c553
LVRYAESRGHEFDHTAPNAYHYRDYVIRALNIDLPYDQFVVEQLAGDLLPQPRLHPTTGANESVLGTGFWYMGEWVHSPTDIRQDEADRIDGVIDTIGRAFLGMTTACARCHDHKFDAISTRDYYALAGFAQSSRYRQVRFESMEQNRKVAQQLAALRGKYEDATSRALSESMKPIAGRFAAYLLAARDAIAGADGDAPSSLDKKTLDELIEHLGQAKKDVADPLHLWALLCHGDDARERGVRALANAYAERMRAQRSEREAAWRDVRVLVDYGRAGPDDWAQDGFAFGTGPVRPGDLRCTTDPAAPVAGVYTYGAARRDPLWSGLKLAGGTERDPGALGKILRSGQTLCTPTFSVKSGTVHYLVQGGGHVQAVVDSHRLIAGPLHGGLVKTIKASDKPRWISHRLDRYLGHRAHLEFVPAADGPFEVLMVVDCQRAPATPPPAESPSLLPEAQSTDKVDSPELLAAVLQKLFVNTCDELAADTPESARASTARLADWMVRHRNLFSAGGPADDKLTELARPYLARRAELAGRIKKESRTAMAIWDGTAEDETLLIRGRSNNPGELVPRRFLEAIAGDKQQKYQTRSGRLEFARQMVDAETNPLIARVMANRVWHQLLGQGIVPTPDNFGVLGRPPSHLELLDHLAESFVDGGWSMKSLIRQIVNSRTYQMSSKPLDAAAEAKDPDNVLLHRMRVRRLEGEAVRDAILTVSGRLDRQLGGPPIPVFLTAFMTGRGRPSGGPLDGAGRRSIYTSVRRNFLSPMMLAFDVPIPTQPVGRRNVSNVPAQALILMNDPFVKQQAELWAKRILADKAATPQQRIHNMYESAFARPPTDAELSVAVAFLQREAAAAELPKGAWRDDPTLWTDLGHVLWNVKEFIFIN